MARIRRIFGITALGLSLTGCVTQEKYNALRMDRDQLSESLAKAQSDASSAQATADAYKRQLQALMDGNNSQTALAGNYAQQLANMQAQLDEANKRYADAISKVGSYSPLPQNLTNELNAFASANPDLVDFDSARGIVKFKSDLTFATGDATLTPKAKEAIGRFATILNSPSAINYELLVAGHTDSTPVSNPATIAKGNKDNWYLSAHRAISVGSDLIANRVSAQRIGDVGYADQHPIASNSSDSGKAQNRRVEVLILPTTIRAGGGGTVSAAPMAAPVRKAPAREMNKDSGSASMNDSSMNK